MQLKIDFNILVKAFLEVIRPLAVAFLGMAMIIASMAGITLFIISIAGKFTPLVLVGVGIAALVIWLTIFHYETLMLEQSNQDHSNS